MKYYQITLIIALILLSGCSSTETITIEVPADTLQNQELVISDIESEQDAGLDSEALEEKSIKVAEKVEEHTSTINVDKVTEEVKETVVIEIPRKVDYDVTFAAQAPQGDWSLPYKEACEEASLLMVYYYFTEKELNNDIMNDEILKLVDWQEERFGYYEDTDTEEMIITAEEYFNMKVKRLDNPTVNILKKELAEGNLIVVPVDGQKLPNPYFRPPGPPYHVLVIRGYDSDEFISNDPGTRRGDGFKYKYDDLVEVIHDFNGGDILNGKPSVIIVSGI